MKTLTFKISKHKWLRNSKDHPDENGSRLLRPFDGLQCCMGQVAEQCGIPRDALSDRGCLKNLSVNLVDLRVKLKKFLGKNGREYKWVEQAYGINDDFVLSDVQKMTQLRNLMKRHGVKFVFTK